MQTNMRMDRPRPAGNKIFNVSTTKKLASSRIHKPPYYKGLNSGSSHAPSHAKTNIESTAQSACYQNVAKEIAQIMQT